MKNILKKSVNIGVNLIYGAIAVLAIYLVLIGLQLVAQNI